MAAKGAANVTVLRKVVVPLDVSAGIVDTVVEVAVETYVVTVSEVLGDSMTSTVLLVCVVTHQSVTSYRRKE